MAKRRGSTKSTPRRPRFRGVNLLNTGVDVYQFNALTEFIMGQGFGGAFIAPLLDPSNKFSKISGKIDGALDIKEVTALLLGDDGGNISGSRVVQGGTGTYTLGSAIVENMKNNAIPTVIKIGGSKLVKKIIQKSGVSRSFNKLSRQLGVSDMVRM